MAQDAEKEVSEALSGALASLILGGQNRTDRGYLSLVRGGYPVSDEFFDFLTATPFRFYGGTSAGGERPAGEAEARAWEEAQKRNAARQTMAKHAREFASLVDAVPGTVGDWIRTNSSLDKFYRETWLDFIDIPNAQLSPGSLAAYAKARKVLGYNDDADETAIAKLEEAAQDLDSKAAAESDVLKQLAYQDAAEKVRAKIQATVDRPKTIFTVYATARNKYQKAIADLNLQMNTDSSDDLKIRVLRDAVSNALDEWQVVGNKAQYETAIATVARVDSTDLSAMVRGLKQRYDSVLALNSAGADAFVPVSLVPSNFLAGQGTWTSLSLNTQKLSDTSSYNHTVTSTGTGAGLFWRSDGSSSDTTVRMVGSTARKLTVSFEFARVAIDRTAWFDATLLASTMWKWADDSKTRLLADGKVPSDTPNLMLPMYATDVIIVRNARVTVALTDSESTALKREVTTSQRSGFWIFSSSSTRTESETRDTYSFSAGTATLSFPGMQIAGFVCDRLPKLPNPSF